MRERITIIGSSLLSALMSIVVFSLMHKCSPQEVVHDTIEKITTHIYDSTKKTIEPKQLPASVSIQTIAVPADINYDSIAKYFYAIHTQSQVVQDTNIRAEIFDKISQNRIIDRQFNYQLLRPIKTIESSTVTLAPKPKNRFFIGGFLQAAFTPTPSIGGGPKISWLTKKDYLFNYGFDIPNKYHQFGTQIELKWK